MNEERVGNAKNGRGKTTQGMLAVSGFAHCLPDANIY